MPITDLGPLLADNQKAVSAFLATAHAVPASAWGQPRAPGKWSPAQVTEHVALAYELSRAVIHDSFPGPAAPRMLRPLIRRFFLAPVLRNGRFGKGGKSPGPFRPSAIPAAGGALIRRLQRAADDFESDLAAAAAGGRTTVAHPFFGDVPLTDYLRLQAIHTRHHHQQLPGGTVPPASGRE